MFEDKTFEALTASALSMAPADVDTRQGSIFRDAITANCLVLAQFYVDLENLSQLLTLQTATGDYLDDRAALFGMERQPGTLSRYEARFTGTAKPSEGDRFFTEEQYLIVFYDEETGEPYFESEEIGPEAASIPEGTPAFPEETIAGLESATVGRLLEAGQDLEDDESLRERVRERIAGPAENGNKQHYKTWCESVQGVGFARIIPLWNGPNTVKGIIYDSEGQPAAEEVIKRVQDYVDPDENSDGDGEGLGEGVANLGAKFTAVAPGKVTINVSAKLTLTPESNIEEAKTEIETELKAYLKSVILESGLDEQPMVRYNEIGAILLDATDVIDYSDLLVNGDVANVQPGIDEVAVLGTVDVTKAEE